MGDIEALQTTLGGVHREYRVVKWHLRGVRITLGGRAASVRMARRALAGTRQATVRRNVDNLTLAARQMETMARNGLTRLTDVVGESANPEAERARNLGERAVRLLSDGDTDEPGLAGIIGEIDDKVSEINGHIGVVQERTAQMLDRWGQVSKMLGTVATETSMAASLVEKYRDELGRPA